MKLSADRSDNVEQSDVFILQMMIDGPVADGGAVLGPPLLSNKSFSSFIALLKFVATIIRPNAHRDAITRLISSVVSVPSRNKGHARLWMYVRM